MKRLTAMAAILLACWGLACRPYCRSYSGLSSAAHRAKRAR